MYYLTLFNRSVAIRVGLTLRISQPAQLGDGFNGSVAIRVGLTCFSLWMPGRTLQFQSLGRDSGRSDGNPATHKQRGAVSIARSRFGSV